MITIKDMPMPKNCYECWFEDANRCYLNILQHIESLDRPEWCPLEEAEPIKHGRWEVIDGTEPRRFSCSKCLYMSWQIHNYCPRCGARMDEVEE